MKRRKRKLHPLRIAAVLMAIWVVFLLLTLPRMQIEAEALQGKISDAATSAYRAKMERKRLTTQLNEANTEDFIVRTARRDYGYCWYGEMIYEVANLDEYQSGSEDVEYTEP